MPDQQTLAIALTLDTAEHRLHYYGDGQPRPGPYWGRRCRTLLAEALGDPLERGRILDFLHLVLESGVTLPKELEPVVDASLGTDETRFWACVHRLRIATWRLPTSQMQASYSWLIRHDPTYRPPHVPQPHEND